ncbi:hypothetical protein BGW36DRAFT_395455 [Talaromyces proteolyticus]|uniref:Uncharacterized protein n=1 Tax=Talaromyces proteolyticus TaxID=1131652 RepID=A0AAD4KUQ4_9EURO|nr:uncharacterized protein BGW36DRAFT_395455 [Talaromyces proteolyticus]KAH8700336.1 hypothetical protein BGW36DRAFT_395455 [Talaromyces proteolyticus]
MTTALRHMATVAEQLRVQGYNTEANKIGQLSVQLVQEFNDASIQLKEKGSNGHYPLAILASDPYTLNKASTSAIQGDGVLPKENAPVEFRLDYPAKKSPPPSSNGFDAKVQLINPSSWAKVVATKSSLQNPERLAVRVGRGGRSITHFGQATRTANRVKGGKEGNEVHTDHRREEIGLEHGKGGVVNIEGPVKSIPRFLSYLAVRVNEGPVYDMSIVDDHKAIIVFQYALHAQIFVDRNTESQATRGESVFGSGDWVVKLGQPMDWTDTMTRMSHPHRERRRLTFVRSKLFADQASYHKWIREVEDVAGVGNVDFVWAFNTGNATAVFFSVAVARKVMQTFTSWRQNRGCYEDLAVTYSTDPCEKDLQLTTQLRYFVQPAHRSFEQQCPGDGEHSATKRSSKGE